MATETSLWGHKENNPHNQTKVNQRLTRQQNISFTTISDISTSLMESKSSWGHTHPFPPFSTQKAYCYALFSPPRAPSSWSHPPKRTHQWPHQEPGAPPTHAHSAGPRQPPHILVCTGMKKCKCKIQGIPELPPGHSSISVPLNFLLGFSHGASKKNFQGQTDYWLFWIL